MNIFCKDLKDRAMKIISCEKKEMIPLTNKEKESYENQKLCHICKKEFNNDNKSGITVIILQNTEELLIISVIYAIKYLKIFL